MKSTGTCTTNQYIKQINADGSVVCGNVPYHWGVTCSVGQYIERIATNGTPTCKTITSLVNNIDCPANQFIYRHSNGTFSCRGYTDTNVFGKNCPTGQSLRGFNSAGAPLCNTGNSGKYICYCNSSSGKMELSNTNKNGAICASSGGGGYDKGGGSMDGTVFYWTCIAL